MGSVLTYISICSSSLPSFSCPASWSFLRPSNCQRTGTGVGGLEVLALVVAMEAAMVGALAEALVGALVEALVASLPSAQHNARECPAQIHATSLALTLGAAKYITPQAVLQLQLQLQLQLLSLQGTIINGM